MQYYRPEEEVVPGHILKSFLGRGAFGQVWKALGPGSVELAIKIISLTNEQGNKEFRAVRLLRRLRHPNLVPLFGFWMKDDAGNLIDESTSEQSQRSEMIIAMGLAEKSLFDRLKECKKIKLKGIPQLELLGYMENAARALDYLNDVRHDLGDGLVGIQHCDVKPANILIVGDAAQVCDFGLARVLTDQQARSISGPAMTPAYVAPEMIKGRPCRTTDQYSLAITYYELRTGLLPFASSDPSTAMDAHLTGNLDLSRLTGPEQRVLRRATALDPSARYPTTVEMVEELRRAVTETSTGRSRPNLELSTTGPQPNQEIVPDHKLLRKIGEGGYGEVWEATGPGGVKCALKIIRGLEASQNVQEFRILDLMKQLEHDHLITLQAYWLLDNQGQPLSDDLVNESGSVGASMLVIKTQLAAQNLAQRLKECHKSGLPGIPPEELLKYLRESASAIDYLNTPHHLLGEKEVAIQHRDIKPENILLTARGSVKVTDFGLAKMIEGTSATIHSKSRGLTVAYAAPEMFKGEVSHRTDQYSLAITYYRLRTGRLPFDAKQPIYTMMLVHTEGKLDFGLVGPAEQEVLQRATQLHPERRYGSCLEMTAALEAAHRSHEGIVVPGTKLETGADRSYAENYSDSDAYGSSAPMRTAKPPRTDGPEVLASFPKSSASTGTRTQPARGPAGTSSTSGGALNLEDDLAPELSVTPQLPEPKTDGSLPDTLQHGRPMVRTEPALKDSRLTMVMESDPALAVPSRRRPPRVPRLALTAAFLLFAMALTATALKIYSKWNETGGPVTSDRATLEQLLAEGKWTEVLKQLPDARLTDEERQQLGQQVRERWLAELPGRKDYAQFLANHPGDPQAVSLYLTELIQKGEFLTAYELLGASDRLPNDERERLSNQVKDAWVGVAEERLRQKDYARVEQLAETIPASYRNLILEDAKTKAGQEMRRIRSEVDDQLARQAFAQAYRFARQEWPQGKELQDSILERWDTETRKLLDEKKDVKAAAKSAKELVEAQPNAERISLLLKALTQQKDFAEAARALVQQRGRIDAERFLAEKNDLERKWLASLDQGPADLRADGYSRCEELLGSAEARRKREALERSRTTAQNITAALQVKNFVPMEIERAGTTLRELKNRADPKDANRIDKLLPLTELAARVAAAPQDANLLDQFVALIDQADALDRERLQSWISGLSDRRMRALLPQVPPDANGWAYWLKESKRAGSQPGPWVQAARVECMVQLSLARKNDLVSEGDLSLAREALRNQTTPIPDEALPYSLYARALGDWWVNEYFSAADLLTRAFATNSEPLQSEPRRVQATTVLKAGVTHVRREGTAVQPFGSAENAARALQWLQLAEQLVGQDRADASLRGNLTLAISLSSSPRDRARGLTEQLVRAKQLDALPALDRYLLWVIHAATRNQDRDAALASYLAAVETARPLLKEKKDDLLAEHLNKQVLPPVLTQDGKELLGEQPGVERKVAYARLCAALALLLKEEKKVWLRFDENPLSKALVLYERAYQHAQDPQEKAEYLVLKAFVFHQIRDRSLKDEEHRKQLQDFAEEATRLAPDYGGSHGLKGILQIFEARANPDLRFKRDLLTEAEKHLSEGLRRADKLPEEKRRKLEALLWQSRAVACLELVNYFMDTPSRRKWLDQGLKDVDAVLQQDPDNLSAWELKGALLEDEAWLLKRIEKFDESVKAFDRAMDRPGPGKMKPWLGRGRVQVRWAEALQRQNNKKEATERLKEAAKDLAEVVIQDGKSVEAAEALYRQALLNALNDRPDLAEDDFAKAVARANSVGSALWEEAITAAWLDFAYREALKKAREKSADAELAWDKAEQRCKALAKFSRGQAAQFELNILRSRKFMTGKRPTGKEELEVLKRGLEQPRLQDTMYQVYLLVERGKLYLYGTADVEANLVRAQQDSEAALRLARDYPIPASYKAPALAIAGLALANLSSNESGKARREQAAEAARRLREAVELEPENAGAWEWKAFWASTLHASLPETGPDQVKELEQAFELITAAENRIPAMMKGERTEWIPLKKEQIRRDLEAARK